MTALILVAVACLSFAAGSAYRRWKFRLAIGIAADVTRALTTRPELTADQIGAVAGRRSPAAYLPSLERSGLVTSRLILDAAGREIRVYRLTAGVVRDA